MAFVAFEPNRKTYAIVVVGVGLGVADKFGIQIPWPVGWALKLLGQPALLAAIRSESAKSADDIVRLVDDILAQITIPLPPSLNPNVDVTGNTVSTITVEVKPLDPVARQ